MSDVHEVLYYDLFLTAEKQVQKRSQVAPYIFDLKVSLGKLS